MMSEMVDQVARALWATDQQNRLGHPWGECPSYTKASLRHRARVLIEAMREPSAAMVNAAYVALESYDLTAEEQPCTVRHAHRAMIDAALNE